MRSRLCNLFALVVFIVSLIDLMSLSVSFVSAAVTTTTSTTVPLIGNATISIYISNGFNPDQSCNSVPTSTISVRQDSIVCNEGPSSAFFFTLTCKTGVATVTAYSSSTCSPGNFEQSYVEGTSYGRGDGSTCNPLSYSVTNPSTGMTTSFYMTAIITCPSFIAPDSILPTSSFSVCALLGGISSSAASAASLSVNPFASLVILNSPCSGSSQMCDFTSATAVWDIRSSCQCGTIADFMGGSSFECFVTAIPSPSQFYICGSPSTGSQTCAAVISDVGSSVMSQRSASVAVGDQVSSNSGNDISGSAAIAISVSCSFAIVCIGLATMYFWIRTTKQAAATASDSSSVQH